MIKRLLISVIALSVVVVPVALAVQTDADRIAKSEALRVKAVKLDLYNQILPVLLTKDQLRRLLPAIEKARQRVRETEKKEYDEMRKFEEKVDAALADAKDKGAVPSQDLTGEISKLWTLLSAQRSQMAELNTEDVQKVFMEISDSGQKKIVANSLVVARFVPGAKAEEWKESDRIYLFVREVLLHPSAYDLLREMSMKKD